MCIIPGDKKIITFNLIEDIRPIIIINLVFSYWAEFIEQNIKQFNRLISCMHLNKVSILLELEIVINIFNNSSSYFKVTARTTYTLTTFVFY